jgi:hypothetical protein
MSMDVVPEIMRMEFYKKDTARHIATKLPPEVRRYQPPAPEIIETNYNQLKCHRFIFEGVDYSSFEKEKLIKLRSDIDAFNKKVNIRKDTPIEYTWDSALVRILYTEGFNIPNSIKVVKEMFRLKALYTPKTISMKVMEVLNSGFLYVHGRDCRFRPIVVINANVLYSIKYEIKDIYSSVVYLFDFVIQNLLIPGAIENWNIILNLKDLYSKLFKDIKSVVEFINDYYRARLFKLYIMNNNKKIQFERIRSTVIVGTKDQLLSGIHVSQVEKKLGGAADDITSYYFPPIFPSKQYLNNLNDKQFLTKQITEDFEQETKEMELSNGARNRSHSNQPSVRNCEIDLNRKHRWYRSFREYEYLDDGGDDHTDNDIVVPLNKSLDDIIIEDKNEDEFPRQKTLFKKSLRRMVTRCSVPVSDLCNSK